MSTLLLLGQCVTACAGGADAESRTAAAPVEGRASVPAEPADDQASGSAAPPVPAEPADDEGSGSAAPSDFHLVLDGRPFGEVTLLAFVRESAGLATITMHVVPPGTECNGTKMLTDLTGRTAPSPSEAYVTHRHGPLGPLAGPATSWREWIEESSRYARVPRATEGDAQVLERNDRELRVRFALRVAERDSSLVGEGVARVCSGDDPF